MYIPILKNQKEEMRALARLNNYFNSNLIPMIEIINEIYSPNYSRNSEGVKITELKKGNKKRTPIRLDPTEENIITFDIINEKLDNRLAFIDYFRFDDDKYKPYKFESVQLAYTLSRNEKLYIDKLLSLKQYPNLIPVISLKTGFDFESSKITTVIKMLQDTYTNIAIRITIDLFDIHKDTISSLLRSSDFLMYDIEEEIVNSLQYEIQDLENIPLKCKKVIINSPRKRNIQNPPYENEDYTVLIDNSALKFNDRSGIDGFGDYCGLKDKLPSGNGSNGTGCALALIYDFEKNKFFSIKNPDSSLGPLGYSLVKRKVLNKKNQFDPDDVCLGYDYLNSFNNGSWSSWHGFTITRYIHQLHLNL
ncbi:MAG: beta family protein [Clostridiales bacterium]|nr:beta family protein [Clostridiales bacterium]